MDPYLENLPNILQESSPPTITAAYFCSQPTEDQKFYGITTVWSQNSYQTAEKISFETAYTFSDESGVPLRQFNSFPAICNSSVLESICPSLTRKAVIKKHGNTTSKKDVLEIWTQNPPALVKSFNLSKYDKHGAVHGDVVFSSLNWSPDESQLVYIAEKKKPKCLGFFEKVASKDVEDTADEKQEDFQGEKYNYEESWGELLTEITNPVICVFNLNDETLTVLSHVPQDLCPAQPQWGPDNSIIFEGLSKQPFRLGRIACEIRPSILYQIFLDSDKDLVELSEHGITASRFCQRVSHCRNKIVFLQKNLKPTGTPHRTAESLFVYNFENNSLVKVMPLLNGDEIPLFSHNLPKSCWLEDNIHIVLPLTINAEMFAGLLNTDTGKIIDIMSCTSILSVWKDFILMSYMKLNSTQASLLLSKYKNGLLQHFVEPQNNDEDMLYGNITDNNGILSHYVIPNITSGKIPLIVNPHGGPHSVYTNDFNKDARMFCKVGYAVLRANYRGSTGFTSESLESLPGNVGTQDVNDVHNLVKQFIEMQSEKIDARNVFVYGGSHGGFLGAHLIGQFPGFYTASALLNPVIDMASMVMVSDIPDWDYVEAGLPYTQDTVPSPNAYRTMLEKSPVIYVKNVKAPVLLCIGGKDARVPPSQGKGYFRLLKANNKITKLLFYPEDSHPLSNVETNGDMIINVCKWFHKYSNK